MQRMAIYDKILLLKGKELEVRAECSCIGTCNINHLKHRWSQSRSEGFVKHLSHLNQYTTENVELKKSKNQIQSFKCNECNAEFKSMNSLKTHIRTIHKSECLKSILKKIKGIL